jgi:PTS system nitrogen regulatory IIA component
MTSAVSLASLVERGGVYYNIGGSAPAAALKESVRALVLPKSVDKPALLKAVLEREALMPTAIGNGVAIPHPRNPIVDDPSLQRVAVLFLKSPLPYDALDRKPVSVLFLILSSDAKSHLGILAAVSYFCQSKAFLDLLATRPSTGELVEYIDKVEKEWESGA